MVIKGTQAWDNLEFFFTKIKSLYSLGKFSKKISLLFLRFSPEFRSSNIFAVTEHTRNQIFLERYPKNFFFKMFTWVLFDGFLNCFSKFGFFIVEICILMWDFWIIFENYSILSHTEHTRKPFHRTLSILRTNFSVCSASGKMLTVFTCTIYAEHTGKWFYRTLSIRGNDLNAGWAY